MEPIRISSPHRSYNAERTIFVDHGSEAVVHRELDVLALANSIQFRLTHRVPWFYNLHTPPPLSRADVFHLFGGCSTSRRPWLTTAERGSHFRRIGPVNGWTLLARNQCKGILCLSHWALRNLAGAVDGHPEQEDVVAKAHVLPPPQRVIPRDSGARDLETVRLVFVGADFFRKGGSELLRAFTYVRRRHENISLDIVSTLNPGRYPAWWDASPVEVDEARAIINSLPGSITWHATLPNEQCLKRMAKATVGVLPTFNDTYGYSVLEMMGAGTPVIATQQRALGEVVTEERGWVVQLPLDEEGSCIPRDRAHAARVSAEVTDQLVSIFESLASKPEQVAPRAARAVEYIRARHDPAAYAADVRAFYRSALE
ncbi:MAG: glycosyltransferase family 4 protein [Actinobacteria bacterium]|nr:glycosyltransferase family 4 protein [Actinomycetota bacterium]